MYLFSKRILRRNSDFKKKNVFILLKGMFWWAENMPVLTGRHVVYELVYSNRRKIGRTLSWLANSVSNVTCSYYLGELDLLSSFFLVQEKI